MEFDIHLVLLKNSFIMKTNQILTADILDIIFDGKNKSYGAYDLRKTYNGRLTRAVIITVIMMLLVFAGTVLSGMTSKSATGQIEIADIEMKDVKNPWMPVPPPPPPPVKSSTPPEVNQKRFVAPIIVQDSNVPDDELIEDIAEDQVISTKTVESEIKTKIVQGFVDDKGSKILEVPKADKEEQPFGKVEIEATFPGGALAWARYLQKNLHPDTPSYNGAPNGIYQVIVKFIVSKEGIVSDVQAESKHGYGMEEEAVKVITRGPKWTPALQNGRYVNAYRRQPVTFIVEEE